MSLNQDLARLSEFFERRRAQVAERLADAPASPVRDGLVDAAAALQADLATVMAGVKEALERHQEAATVAVAQIEAARNKTEAAAKAYQDKLAKTAEPPTPASAPEPAVNGDALHARLRGLLLGEADPAPRRQPVREDPGSITDDLPAFDDAVAEDAVTGIDLLLLHATPATPMAASAQLSERAQTFLDPRVTLREYVAILRRARLFPDVAKLLAIGLPPREAVWWAALCIRSEGEIGDPADEAALGAAVAWVLDPTASCRRIALGTGQQATPHSASGCAALAAGQMPGPLATAGALQADPASQHVYRAVTLASGPQDPAVAHGFPQVFVDLGLGVASGEFSWKKLVSPIPPKDVLNPRDPAPALELGDSAATTLNGHNLGKLLLVELGLVADPAQPPRKKPSLVDEAGFRWESSDSWNSLGM